MHPDQDAIGLTVEARTLAWVLDACLLRHGTTSAWITDRVMEKLAKLAGDDVDRARAVLEQHGLLHFEPGIAVAQVALRRVFDGFTVHRADAPEAPRRVNAD